MNTLEKAHPVKLSGKLYKEALTSAKAEHRSIPKQIEFWAEVGKACIENPELPTVFVMELLHGRHDQAEEMDWD